MKPHYGWTRIFRLLGFGRPELTGLPIAIFGDLIRMIKRMRDMTHPNPAIVQKGASQ
jgi:hypothetical protein